MNPRHGGRRRPKKNILSIPYWDFLVLNRYKKLSKIEQAIEELSIPYWDFLVLNPEIKAMREFAKKLSFNSLLGFSSFESVYILSKKPQRKKANFQFPIGIF